MAGWAYSVDRQAQWKQEYDAQAQAASEALEWLRTSATTDEGMRLMSVLDQAGRKFDEQISTVFKLDPSAAQQRMAGLTETIDAFDDAAQAIGRFVDEGTAEAEAGTAATAQRTAEIMLLLGAVSAALAIAIGVVLARAISAPVVRIAAAAERVAAGDLTVAELPVRSGSEFGALSRSINSMVKGLRELVGQVNSSSQHVVHSAEELLTHSARSSRLAVLLLRTTGSNHGIIYPGMLDQC